MKQKVTATRTTEFISKYGPSPEMVVIKVDGEEKLRITPEEAADLLRDLGMCDLVEDIVEVPKYGRKKVDELITLVGSLADTATADQRTVAVSLPTNDFIILADMLREMDRHLPDFFEEEET